MKQNGLSMNWIKYLLLTLLCASTFVGASIFTTSRAYAQEWLENRRTVDTNGARARSGEVDWLDDRARTEGPGIRTGSIEVHPGLGAEMGYDTNIFYADVNPKGAAIFRVTPSIMISTVGPARQEDGEASAGPSNPPKVDFRTGISGSYLHYFTDLVTDNLQADIGMDLKILPKRPISFVLLESFGRSIVPFTQNNTDAPINYARMMNRTGFEVQARTHGNILEGRLGYNFGWDFFEGQQFRYNSNITNTIVGGASWKFLPHTSLIYRTELIFQDYFAAYQSPSTLLANNTRYNTMLGLNGAITPKLSLQGLLGYGAGFYTQGSEFNGIIGNVELRYRPIEAGTMSLGFDRSFNASYIGNYFLLNRFYLRASIMGAHTWTLGGEISLGTTAYGAALSTTGAQLGNELYRHDIRPMASVFGEYRVRDWLAFNATIQYIGDFTSFEFVYNQTSGAQPFVDPASFQKFNGFVGVRVSY